MPFLEHELSRNPKKKEEILAQATETRKGIHSQQRGRRQSASHANTPPWSWKLP